MCGTISGTSSSFTFEFFPPTEPHSNRTMPSPIHLLSKVGDPIFALFIGLSAAATRINREEKELGRSTQVTLDAGKR
jgi:hypothetical protein